MRKILYAAQSAEGARRHQLGSGMTKAPSTRRLRIPVRFVDSLWECSLGGAVPVKEATEAELVVDRNSIWDRAFLELMERKARHKVLEEGTPLLVSLTVKHESPPPEKLKPLLKRYDDLPGRIGSEFLNTWSPGTLSFVEVNLAGPDRNQARLFDTDRGGLWLITQGVEAIGLASTTVRLPKEISADPVVSLNHAYTKLSEVFETSRISHTGNIYTRVLYQERNGKWYPLDLLRNKALDKQGLEIAKGLWEAFMANMTMTNKTSDRKD
jgi:hypothetical protein